jgi:glutaredoxin
MIVKAKRIRLFIKPYCGWCHKAMRWLDEHEVDYEKVDVVADESAFDEMIRISGQDLAPSSTSTARSSRISAQTN